MEPIRMLREIAQTQSRLLKVSDSSQGCYRVQRDDAKPKRRRCCALPAHSIYTASNYGVRGQSAAATPLWLTAGTVISRLRPPGGGRTETTCEDAIILSHLVFEKGLTR